MSITDAQLEEIQQRNATLVGAPFIAQIGPGGFIVLQDKDSNVQRLVFIPPNVTKDEVNAKISAAYAEAKADPADPMDYDDAEAYTEDFFYEVTRILQTEHDLYSWDCSVWKEGA